MTSDGTGPKIPDREEVETKEKSDAAADHSDTNDDVDKQSHCVRYDVALNSKKWDNYCKEISDSDDEELKYDASVDRLNPGEVEDDIDTKKTKPHKTQLDFSECQPSSAGVGEHVKNEAKVSYWSHFYIT